MDEFQEHARTRMGARISLGTGHDPSHGDRSIRLVPPQGMAVTDLTLMLAPKAAEIHPRTKVAGEGPLPLLTRWKLRSDLAFAVLVKRAPGSNSCTNSPHLRGCLGTAPWALDQIVVTVAVVGANRADDAERRRSRRDSGSRSMPSEGNAQPRATGCTLSSHGHGLRLILCLSPARTLHDLRTSEPLD